ncbi:MAG: hypothetical protein FJ297_14995 [Planctomycetes bacterium]|nr:hypothetical protein [Planctomycetota bacterium]
MASFLRRGGAVLVLLASGWIGAPSGSHIGRAQEAGTPPVTAPPSGAAPDELREQTIYVPFEKLREVFEKEGRGVFLPYEKFQALWQAAQAKLRTETETPPPVGAMVTEISSKATATKDVLVVEAELRVELLRAGWHRVPIRLADAAIRSARIGDQPARIIPAEGGGYELLYELPKDAPPQPLVVRLDYAKVIQKTPGRNSVTVQAPQAPVNRWEIHIPDSGVKVDVQPLLAASQPPDTPPSANETVLLAFLGAADSVRIDWNPKAEGATGLEALLSVQSEQEVVVDEGVIRSRSRLTYQISRSELNQLEIEVPSDQKVAGVFDANIRSWEVRSENDAQVIAIQLFEAARATQNVTIELEKFTTETGAAEVGMPVVRARHAGRQQGLIVVQVSPTLRSTAARRDGLLQLDTAELPRTLANRTWDYAFRYAALPFTLALTVEKVQSRVRVEEFVHAYLEPDALNVDLLAVYGIERAGLFQLQVEIPEGYEIRAIRGQEAPEIAAAAVDSHHPDPAAANRRLVNLARKAEGRVGLLVQLTKRLTDPNLMSPTGQASTVAIAVPRAVSVGLEQATGRLIVFAPESLRVTPTTQTGLTNISFREAVEPVPYLRRPETQGTMREVLAQAYTRDAVELAVSAERRKPQVHVRQFLVVGVESGVARFTATFHYDISYSPVKQVRIDVPRAVSSLLRNDTAGIRDEIPTTPPSDVPADHVPWLFTGESEFLGPVSIRLSWQRPLDALGIGQSVDLEVPHLRPNGTDRAWGQIVVTKSETIDVQPSGEPTGVRPIDPQQDLMPGGDGTNAARAFEFHQDFGLKLTATRFQLVEVKRTSIEGALIRAVATRSGQLDVQALYRMRSARQRLAVRFPESVDAGTSFDADPAKLNGQSVTMEQGEDRTFFVPLVGRGPDEPFVLELRYTIADHQGHWDFPVFPDDPAVSQVFVSAFVPEELAVVATGGPWTNEQYNPWRVRIGDAVSTDGRWSVKSDAEIWQQIGSGIPMAADPLSMFSVQGDRYLFSTLRPEAPPEGALGLNTVERRWMHAAIFAAALLIGLAFLARSITTKLVVAVCVLILVVGGGVFWPTAAANVLDVPFVLAAFGTGGLWVVGEMAKGFAGAKSLVRRFSRRPPSSRESGGPAPSDGSGSSSASERLGGSEPQPGNASGASHTRADRPGTEESNPEGGAR